MTYITIKNEKSRWSIALANWQIFLTHRQLFFTKNTFDKFLTHIKNEEITFENVFNNVIIIYLKMIFSIVEQIFNQLDNVAILVAIYKLKQFIKKIHTNITFMRQNDSTISINTRLFDISIKI